MIATVEPWHGTQVVTYTPDDDAKLWRRHVVDEQLRWGHGVWMADLDGDGADELVIGVRDDPAKGDAFKERRGVAVEDLTVADLNGDGKPDIVACGRATKNVRIYWNEGK